MRADVRHAANRLQIWHYGRSVRAEDHVDLWTREKLGFSEGQKIMHSDTGTPTEIAYASCIATCVLTIMGSNQCTLPRAAVGVAIALLLLIFLFFYQICQFELFFACFHKIPY